MVIVPAKCTRDSCQVVLQVKRFFSMESLEKKLTNYFLSNQADLFVIDTTAAAASMEVFGQAEKNMKRLKY